LRKLLGLATALLALVTAFAVWQTARTGGSNQRNVTVTITELADTIKRPTSISGTVEGHKGGDTIWVFNRRVQTGYQLFYPEGQPCPIEGNSWRCPAIYVGNDTDNGSYDVVAIVLDGTTQRQLTDYVSSDGCNKTVCFPIPLPNWVARDDKTVRRE
jgi:hypothetical protein